MLTGPMHGSSVGAGRTDWLKSAFPGDFTHSQEGGVGIAPCDSGYHPLGAIGFNHG